MKQFILEMNAKQDVHFFEEKNSTWILRWQRIDAHYFLERMLPVTELKPFMMQNPRVFTDCDKNSLLVHWKSNKNVGLFKQFSINTLLKNFKRAPVVRKKKVLFKILFLLDSVPSNLLPMLS